MHVRLPLFAGLLSFAQILSANTYDVVVVGTTPAGIAAAVNAAREGATVALFDDTGHVGGLASGGLSNTDFKTFAALGGTFREFMHRVEQYYERTYGMESQQVIDCVRGAWYEPKVARAVFEELLREQSAITLRLHHRVVDTIIVPSGGKRRLQSVALVDLRSGIATNYHAQVFIDATYEGDLAGAARVPYRLGCESKAEYNEDVSSFEVSNRYVQTYNFRVCLTRDPSNRIEIGKPHDYNEAEFLPIVDLFRSGRLKSLSNPDLSAVLTVRPMPNAKADFNDYANSPISLSLKNINHAWPEGSPQVRDRIFQRYKSYSLGLFWFLGNNPDVPAHIRQQMREWGLPRDEYVETEHWSPVLYVREGRRIVGEYVFTQHDTQPDGNSARAPLHTDSVAIGDYSLSCHGVFSPSPGVNVGKHGRAVRPFQLPYRIMIPIEMEALLVPVAVSATHIGYSAIRMEPAWTALGQAAGIAAAMAVKEGCEVRRVNVPRLQARLHALGAFTIYISDLFPESRVRRPSWDPPGDFTANVPTWPCVTEYSRAAQYFGTQGFFHYWESRAGVGAQGRATGQWRISYPNHDVGFSKPIDVELSSHWSRMAGIGSIQLPNLKLSPTRGEFLLRLYSHLESR